LLNLTSQSAAFQQEAGAGEVFSSHNAIQSESFLGRRLINSTLRRSAHIQLPLAFTGFFWNNASVLFLDSGGIVFPCLTSGVPTAVSLFSDLENRSSLQTAAV